MSKIEIIENLKKQFNVSVSDNEANEESYIEIRKEDIVLVASFLKKEDMDMLYLISAVDKEDCFLVYYHFLSTKNNIRILVRVRLEKEAPMIASLCSIYKSANWFEREEYDLMGIIFEGHEDLTRILLPQDWEGYPLRKDYKMPTSYHGIRKDSEF